MQSENKEIFKDIPGYEGLYQVSNIGNVKALQVKKLRGRGYQLRPEILLKHKIKDHGYLEVVLCKDNSRYGVCIQRLVAITFIPNPENKPTVNHKNGIKNDNTVNNLEWATFKEQINHADNTGLRNIKGENHKLSKFSNSDIKFIRESNLTAVELAKRFNVNRSCIFKIKSRLTWRHVA